MKQPGSAEHENYQPQVGNTTNGPNIHTYIPRSDGTVLIGGVAYIPQITATAYAASSVNAAAQPYIIPPGCPTAPAINVLDTPLQYPPLQYCLASPYYLAHSEAPQHAMVYAQPVYPHAMSTPYPYQPYHQYMIQPQPATHGFPSFQINQPAHDTIGLTGTEVLNQQLATAQGLEMNKKQEMKPADDDPLRMYWVRELDGTYTQRNRLTIDSGDIGECRWYAQDGVFYAVRLP